MRARLVTRFAAVVAAVVVLAGCGGEEGGGELGLAEPGKILVGSDIAFAPFEFVEGGQNKGFDIDLMNEIADRLGVTAEFVNTGFDTLFTAVASGRYDVGMSAITITPERERTVNFSEPYFLASQALVAPTAGGITGVDDLTGQDLAVQAATTGADYAAQNFKDATIVQFPTSEAAFTALDSGQVDAVFIDQPVAEDNVESIGGLEIAEQVDTDEEYGIAVPDDNTALLEALDEQLRAIIEDGTYEEIYGRWFDSPVPQQFRASGGGDGG
ncbi:MAG: basic amino acid ABC transporter substrate-binding protein [Actinomycetota bacterium]|nr:basic amino acid ABC transporter substrate-binding protein [Actinomycetota bacterium]